MKSIIQFSLITLCSVFLMGCGAITEPLSYGNPDADVVIEIFSDVECPACASISPQVKDAAETFKKDVLLKYYHFPLTYHKYAFDGAEASECARDQGKGWQYLEDLYANQTNLSDNYFVSLANKLGLDEEAFSECFKSHKYKSVVMSQYNEGRSRTIPGTPTIYVNGNVIKWSGNITFEAYLKSLIN